MVKVSLPQAEFKSGKRFRPSGKPTPTLCAAGATKRKAKKLRARRKRNGLRGYGHAGREDRHESRSGLPRAPIFCAATRAMIAVRFLMLMGVCRRQGLSNSCTAACATLPSSAGGMRASTREAFEPKRSRSRNDHVPPALHRQLTQLSPRAVTSV